MGHRALVAYENDSGTHDVYYSHWGASNLRLYRPLCGGTQPGEDGIDAETYAEDVTLSALASDHLSFVSHEALYVVPREGDARAFETLHLCPDGDHIDGWDESGGVLYEPDWYDGEAIVWFSSYFEGYRQALTRMVKTDRLAPQKAREELERYVWAKVGKRPNASVPEFSPVGTLPPNVDGSISAAISEMEERSL